MNNETSIIFDEEPNIIKTTLYLKKEHVSYIKKINSNASEAIRKIIDEQIRNKKIMFYEKHLISFSIGLILLGFGVIMLFMNIYLGFNTVWAGLAAGAFPVIIIFIALLMLVRDRGMFGSS